VNSTAVPNRRGAFKSFQAADTELFRRCGVTSRPWESACLGRRPARSRASQKAAAVPFPVPAMKATCPGSQVSRLQERTCASAMTPAYHGGMLQSPSCVVG
jgi:hypothetical protein